MNPPLVTAFICSYNKGRFVEAALESVRNQTFRDFELIVVDDCSTDNSVSIIDAWLERTGFPCRFVRHEANRGVPRTVNEILTMARGRYIASLGADDLWHENMLQSFVSKMEELPSDVCVVYGDAEIIDQEGRIGPVRFIESYRTFLRPPEGRIFHVMLEGNFIPGMSALYRLECLRAVGGYDESLWYEDWDMWLKLADRYLFAFLPGALAQYRVVPGSMMRSEIWRPRLAESELSIRLKWLGRDELGDRILAKGLGLPAAAEQLYALASPASGHYAVRGFLHHPGIPSLVLMLCVKLRVPYPTFRKIEDTAKVVRATVRRWFVELGLAGVRIAGGAADLRPAEEYGGTVNPFAEVQSIDFVDIGCRGKLDDRWRDLVPLLDYTGFDADATECERLSGEAHAYRSHRYLPFAIAGEERDMVFYQTRSPACSSLLEPHRAWIDRFEIGKLMEVAGTTTVSCTTLNALAQDADLRADVMKVDSQGLDILLVENGDALLETAFCIETEPGFAENYCGELTFAQNESYLRGKGFLLFDVTVHTAARKNPLARYGKHQALWCEALWLYDYVGQNRLPSREQALKALLICKSLGFLDYGFELATFFGNQCVLDEADLSVLANESFWIRARSSQGQLSRTARLLGFLPRTLQKRLRYGIEELFRGQG